VYNWHNGLVLGYNIAKYNCTVWKSKTH